MTFIRNTNQNNNQNLEKVTHSTNPNIFTDVGVYVKDLSVYMVNTADDMDKLMTMGNKNRYVIFQTKAKGPIHTAT